MTQGDRAEAVASGLDLLDRRAVREVEVRDRVRRATLVRGGEVARTPLGLPMLWSGNFADVFKVHCPTTGNTWALKCFTLEVSGQCDRYRHIVEKTAKINAWCSI